MSLLAGARIALLEARLASEMATLVRREGGEPVCAPAVFEARVDVAAMIPSFTPGVRPKSSAFTISLTRLGAIETP